MEAGAPAGMWEEVRASSRPAQPDLLLPNRSHQHPAQATPLELNRWTGTGIWRLRPRRTYRAGTRAWPPASAPSPPAGPNCWGTPGASPLGGPGWAQAIHPGACRTLPPRGPGEGGSPQGLSSTTQLRGQYPPRLPEETPDGHFLPELFPLASGLLSAGEEMPPGQRCASEGHLCSAQDRAQRPARRESTDSHHVNQLREPSSSSWAGHSRNLPEV